MKKANCCYIFIYPEGAQESVAAARLTLSKNNTIFIDYGIKYLKNINYPIDPINIPCRNSTIELNANTWHSMADAYPYLFSSANLSIDKFLDYNQSLNCLGNIEFKESLQSKTEPYKPILFSSLNFLNKENNISQTNEDIINNFTVQYEGDLYTIKFAKKPKDVLKLKIEYAYMQLADACGINIPMAHLLEKNNTFFLLTERIDRESSSEGQYTKIGYLSAKSFLNEISKDNILNKINIADNMRKYCPENLYEFLQRSLFNILVNNEDCLRHTGFLFTANSLRLAPAINFQIKYTPIDNQLIMKQIKNIVNNSERSGLIKSNALDILREIFDILSNWKNFFKNIDITKQEINDIKLYFSKILQIAHTKF